MMSMRCILVFCTPHVPIFALAYNQLLGSVQAIGFFDLVPFSHGVLRKYR